MVEGLRAGDWAADIGAGTGISTRLLMERGINVHAVEPNAAMREKGEAGSAAFAQESGCAAESRWHETTGEATGLPSAYVSLVLCAQSLHWLDATSAMVEFARILVPGGAAVAVWNVHDVRDAFMASYRELVMRHAKDVPRSPWFRNDACALAGPLAAGAGFVGYTLREFPMEQPLTLEGLIGRAASSSYMPQTGPARDAADADLTALFFQHERGGVVTMRYMCEVHRVTLARRQQ